MSQSRRESNQIKFIPKVLYVSNSQLIDEKSLRNLRNYKQRSFQMMHSSKPKSKQNIDIIISIGDYNLEMSIPRQTKVSSLLTIVKNYQKIHDVYAPMDSFFIGLASKDNNPVIDYWLTQNELDFCRFTKRKLELKALYSIEKYTDKLCVSDFEFLKCLGKGMIGEVYLVRNKITGYLFAMKRLRKQGMHDFKTWEGVIKQKKILSLLPPNNHTVNFHGSFESQNYFNFLLDYYPGGELFYHLSEQTDIKLTEKDIKVYFCEVILAMEYLHKNKILYRDLKPENILVDIQGHLRITDFGMSRFGFEEENNAYSFCGSEQYMAPQLMEHKNYNFSADFYSIGAILYELMTNYPPYYGIENEEKLQQMKSMDLDLSFIESPHLKELLMNLLNPDPELRLCNYQQIKNNPWLSDIDWKEVESKKQTLKFAPNIYKTYIGEEFLQLQEEVERMNGSEDEDFDPIFDSLFNFIKPTSQSVVLGIRPSTASDKPYLREISDSQKNSMKDHMAMKRKTTGFIKEKPKQASKHKQNYSIQLFEREDSSTSSSHTTSTQNSNVSNLPYDPKTTRNADLVKNKENLQTFKKCSSKKMMVINDTLAKITKQPSQKKLLTKQPSQGNLLKQRPLRMEQKIFLKQPTTPIRLVTHCQTNSGNQQKTTSHFVSIRQETNNHIKDKENHFTSRSKIQTYQPTITRQPSSKRLTTRQSENFESLRQGEKENQKRSNMKSKTKEKSKSKDKLELRARTKQNYPSNSISTVKGLGPKVKLPSGTYKIKLV